MDNENAPFVSRRKISIDTVSILEGDAITSSPEDGVLSDLQYLEIIRSLPTPEEKFIALALDCELRQNQIAFALHTNSNKIRILIIDMKKHIRKLIKDGKINV